MLLGLSNLKEFSMLWPIQFLTHLTIHVDLKHLVANLSGLALTSLYERRVGTKRFLAVASVSALSSGLSIFFFGNAVVVCGISGGVCGLAAAYFIDFQDVRGKDLVMALASFTVLFIFFSYTASNSLEFSSSRVDHWGHIFGAIGGILYCRFTWRQKPKRRDVTTTSAFREADPDKNNGCVSGADDSKKRLNQLHPEQK